MEHLLPAVGDELPFVSGALEVRSAPLSTAEMIVDGLPQNRLAAAHIVQPATIPAEPGSDEPPTIPEKEFRAFVVPEDVPSDFVSEFTLPNDALVPLCGFFRWPDGSAEVLTSDKGLSDPRYNLPLDRIAGILGRVIDPETNKPTRRLHLIAPLEESRIRFPMSNGIWRWTASVQIRSKEPTVLVQDVSEQCGVAYGFGSPEGTTQFPLLLSFSLAHQKSGLLEQHHAWTPRSTPYLTSPFRDGSRVRRSGDAAMMAVNFHDGSTRLLTLGDDSSLSWSACLPDAIVGRYYMDGRYGLVTRSPDRRTFRIIPPNLMSRYLVGPCAALAPYVAG